MAENKDKSFLEKAKDAVLGVQEDQAYSNEKVEAEQKETPVYDYSETEKELIFLAASNILANIPGPLTKAVKAAKARAEILYEEVFS